MEFARAYHNIKLFIKDIFYAFSPREIYTIYRLKKEKKLFTLKDLIPVFSGTSFFALGTGGSTANLQDCERLKDRNVLTITMGGIFVPHCYGFTPTLWYLHNEDSVLMAIEHLKKENLVGKFDFSNTYILVPKNFSDAKSLRFSTPAFRELRNMLGSAKYVPYADAFSKIFTAQSIPHDWLNLGGDPLYLMQDSSSVERIFLPVLAAIGVKKIYFSGVDNLPHTGHFWDRTRVYQDRHGKPLSFAVQSDKLSFCYEKVKPILDEKGISVHRLEKDLTLLTCYPYMDFEHALQDVNAKKVSTYEYKAS